jgi:BirA family biotin operon repressor/biotin-[acetyl-CoA-carboxylase] ligase
MDITILRFNSVTSTNDIAAQHARYGAEEGICVIARQQTAGRGRHGRTWISEPGDGIYFSIVLRPTLPTQFLSLVPLMAGVAVYDTIAELGLRPDIKWPNDILVGEKKVSGILAETVETRKGLSVIVGIGINVKRGNLPDEIAERATSLESELGAHVAANELEATLAKYLLYFYEILQSDTGRTVILRHWQQRSSYFSGKRVRVKLHEGVIEGTTDGLTLNGGLRIQVADGSIKEVQAGDVEQLREA